MSDGDLFLLISPNHAASRYRQRYVSKREDPTSSDEICRIDHRSLRQTGTCLDRVYRITSLNGRERSQERGRARHDDKAVEYQSETKQIRVFY